MPLNNPHLAYSTHSILTAKPEELNLMLYNGLIRFLIQANKAIEEKNIQKAHDSLIRAENILLEFRNTIKPGYAISTPLRSLYDYMYRRLVTANLRKDAAIVTEVLGHATKIRDSWSQAIKSFKEQKQQPLAHAK